MMAELDLDANELPNKRQKTEKESSYELLFGSKENPEEDEEEEEKQLLQEIEDQIVEIEPEFAAVIYKSEE